MLLTMNRLLKQVVYLWGVLIVVSGCGGGDKVDPEDPDAPGFEVKFEVGETSYGELANGGSKQVRVTSNAKWQVSGMTDWCEVVPESGEGDAEVTITVKPNPTYEERKVVLTFQAQGVTKKVTVTQKKKDALIVTESHYAVEAEGEEIEVELKSNLEYEIIIKPEYAEWIKQVVRGRALTEEKFIFQIAANKGYDDRSGEIVFKDKGSDLSDTVFVTQSKVHMLILVQEEYVVEPGATALVVELQRSVAYEVIIPKCMRSWITRTESRALETDKLNFMIQANTGRENRSGAIIIKETDGAAMELLTVVQLREAAIVASAVEQIVPVDGASLNIDVKEGISYDVTIPRAYESWIRQEVALGRSLGTERLKFNILPNDTRENREGQIWVASGGSVDTVRVFQPVVREVSKTVVLSPLNYHVGLQDTTIRLSLRGDADYEFVLPESAKAWVVNQSGVTSGVKNIDLMVRANGTAEDREVRITVRNKLFDTEETITIVQEGEKFELIPGELTDFSAKGGTQHLYVSTNLNEWDVRVVSGENWCQLVKEGDAVKVVVTENVSIESRKAEIVAIAGRISKRLEVKQNGVVPYIEIGEGTALKIGEWGGVLTSPVTTNAGELLVNVESGSEWCYASLTEGVLRVVVDTNIEIRERVAVLLLRAGNLTERVSVTQAGAVPYLNLSVEMLTFGKSAASEDVYVYTNEKVWSASVSGGNWCALSKRDSLVIVSVSENMQGESRSATVTIRAGELSRNVTVTQGANNEVVIWPEVEDSWTNDEILMEASNVKYIVEFETNEIIEEQANGRGYINVGGSRYEISGLKVKGRLEGGRTIYSTELYVWTSLTGRVKLTELRFVVDGQYVAFGCDCSLLSGEKNRVSLSKMN